MEFGRRYTVTCIVFDVPSPRISAYTLYFLETTIIGLYFAADNVGLSSLKFFWWAHKFSDVSAVQSHPRSLMLVPIESAYATSYKSVIATLVLSCSFGDFARFLCSWPHPYSTLILGVFPLHKIAHVGTNVSRDLRLFGREIIFVPNCVKNIPQCHGRTDRCTFAEVIAKLTRHITFWTTR